MVVVDVHLDAGARGAALEDPSAHVRSTVAYALARIGDPASAPKLEARVLTDTDFTARAAAQEALDSLRRSGR
jgi:HEAT repeat protein